VQVRNSSIHQWQYSRREQQSEIVTSDRLPNWRDDDAIRAMTRDVDLSEEKFALEQIYFSAERLSKAEAVLKVLYCYLEDRKDPRPSRFACLSLALIGFPFDLSIFAESSRRRIRHFPE
jgi:hypothetical protein